MRKRNQKYIRAIKLIEVKMKREDQKCINTSKLIEVKMKKGKT